VDGPDADDNNLTYLFDIWTMPEQDDDPGSGLSTKRISFETGHEIGVGGNGIKGHHETSEDIRSTWDLNFTIPNPGISLSDTIAAISGPLSGVLSQTFMPYLATSTIRVDAGDSLIIMPGVQILFEPGVGFEIYGHLEILGSESNFVLLQANDLLNNWQGISLFAGSDTVKIRWLNIAGADEAFHSFDRPLTIHHVIISDNTIGIRASNSAYVSIKNATIIDNLDEAIIAEHNSRIIMTNSIAWNNNVTFDPGPDIIANSAITMDIHYCNVDSIEGNIYESSSLDIQPIFKSAGMLKYLPDTLSATIDAGDPLDNASLEPIPNGGKINQGVYGGSSLATATFQPSIATNVSILNLAAKIGETDSKTVAISNAGNVDLEVNQIIINSPEFNYDLPLPVTIAAGASIDININFTPATRIAYSEQLQIYNTDPHYPDPGMKLQLMGVGLNTDPVIQGLPSDASYVDSLFSYRINATDADNDSLSYILQQLPPWLALSSSGQISGTPALSDTGSHLLEVTINDGYGGNNLFSSVLTVININDPPVINNTSLLNGVQDMVYIDTIKAFDADYEQLLVAPLTKPAWMNVTAAGAISGIPANEHVGNDIPVSIAVFDHDGDSDTLNTTIDIRNTNDSPQIISTTLRNAIEDLFYTDTVFASDPDGDSLAFVAVNTPDWLKVNPAGILSGYPKNDDVATNIPLQITVSDLFGSYDTLRAFINVINTNDAPEIIDLVDTLIYTYMPFNYTIQAQDIDGDPFSFTDDTPLFDIAQNSGNINFTPSLSDTGYHMVRITVGDGQLSHTESFNLIIEPNQIIPAQNLTIQPGDQELLLRWLNPENQFYSGTLIKLSNDKPISHPDSGITLLDTLFAPNTNVQLPIKNLEIGRNYFISLFNYFDPGIKMYSTVTQTSKTTLAPNIYFNLSERHIFLQPGDSMINNVQIKNLGGGTLSFQLCYDPDSLINGWFHIDTNLFTLSPHDSISLPFVVFADSSLPDTTHQVNLILTCNQPNWQPLEVKLVMHILFDHFAPQLKIVDQPQEICKYAAMYFRFSANDYFEKDGYLIGDPVDSLRMNYQLINALNGDIISDERDYEVGELIFYPLNDGTYQLRVWVSDSKGNGSAEEDVAFEKYIFISATNSAISKRRWHMLSFPRVSSVPLNAFFDDIRTGIFRWSNKMAGYVPYNDATLQAGTSVWIYSPINKNVDLRNMPDFPDEVAVSEIVSVELEPGWNQIGIPKSYPMFFSDLQIQASHSDQPIPILEAIEQKLAAPAVYWYEPNRFLSGYQWGMIDSTVAYPWQGYWIFVSEPVKLTFPAIPVYAVPGAHNSQRNDINVMMKANAWHWKMSLTLHNDTHSDMGNIIGVTNANESLPIYEPPHLDEYCSLDFASDLGEITSDLREPFSDLYEIKEWQLQATTSNIGRVHTLSWDEMSSEGLYIFLVDIEQEKIINMKEHNTYQFKANSHSRFFKIYATQDVNYTPSIVPSSYRLLQNYPNPFNPATTIKFGIPEGGHGKLVQLKIYNILGQEISTLIDKNLPAGYHQVTWEGLNAQSKPVASGIYFYRLITAGHQFVRKMIFLK
jgi:hypothetical protein